MFKHIAGAFPLERGERTIQAIVLALSVLVAPYAEAADIDTEHIFGFMIGSDVGPVGEREFQSATTGRFGKSRGSYAAGEQEFELELVPAKDIRIEIGSSFSAHRIAGVSGFDDRRSLDWQGASADFRYRFIDREVAPIGMTLAIEAHVNRIDETRAVGVRSYGTGLTLAFDREIVPDVAVAALNLIYQPEWTRYVETGAREREASIGLAFGLLMQIHPGILLGGEARYMRRYEGIGLDELSGQALFVGPTAYVQLTDSSRLTASWSTQIWGREGGSASALDLVNFERHQARLVYGVNF
jgi:hypothetical protein